eukprot:1411527-Prymnesium_polylepis.2
MTHLARGGVAAVGAWAHRLYLGARSFDARPHGAALDADDHHPLGEEVQPLGKEVSHEEPQVTRVINLPPVGRHARAVDQWPA